MCPTTASSWESPRELNRCRRVRTPALFPSYPTVSVSLQSKPELSAKISLLCDRGITGQIIPVNGYLEQG
jgi:hypothetical protein